MCYETIHISILLVFLSNHCIEFTYYIVSFISMHANNNVICRYVSFYVLDHMLHNESKNQLNFVFKDRASNDEILRYVSMIDVQLEKSSL